MPLIVKPNPRRMQAFRDTPSERGFVKQRRPALSPTVGRPLLVVAIVGVIVIGLKLLAML
ncbi:MAG TPA: hypothetical protein VHY35_09630 [Stellaceae bacterium]|nr:hypothetical protein [Stellaceae bacterium]